MTPTRTMAIMMKERWVATSAPDSADALVGGFAQAVDDREIAQPQGGRVGRVGGADVAEHEARGADALEVEIAREVVAAGPQRLERRRQPCLELDEAADRRRG